MNRRTFLIFWFSSFLTFKFYYTFIFERICPCKDLKWPLEWFLSVSEIENFLPFFIFGESPEPRKIFFQKLFFSAIRAERNSQYFLAGLVLNERYYDAAHETKVTWDTWISCEDNVSIYPKSMSDIVIFLHLGLISSKNIEYCPLTH